MSSKTQTTLNDLLSSDAPELTPEQKALALDDILAGFGSAPQAVSASAPTVRPAPAASAGSGAAASPSLVIDGVDFSEFLSDDPAPAPEPVSAAFSEAQPPASPSEAPASSEPAPQADPHDTFPAASAADAPEAAAHALVIDGVDFSEFLSGADTAEAAASVTASAQSEQTPPSPAPAPSAAEDENAPRPQICRRKTTPGGIVLRIAAFAAVLATVVFLYTQVMQDRVSSASFDDVCRAVLSQLDLDEMQQADAQMVRRLYGFAPSEMDGCMLYYPSTNMGARELLIVKLSDLSQQKSVSDAVSARRQTQMNSFEGYGVEQYDLLEHSVLAVQGNYILFVVHENADAARQAFLKAL